MAKQTSDSSKRLTFWAVLFGLASLAVISIASLFVWHKMGHVALGLHGWLALIAGAVGSVLLGGGLMALSFILPVQVMMTLPIMMMTIKIDSYNIPRHQAQDITAY